MAVDKDTAHIAHWIQQVYDLIEQDQAEQALDVVFGEIDDMLLEEDFLDVDIALRTLEVDKLGICGSVGVLSVTVPAKEFLADRAGFYARFDQYLRDTGVDPARHHRLLDGLS